MWPWIIIAGFLVFGLAMLQVEDKIPEKEEEGAPRDWFI